VTGKLVHRLVQNVPKEEREAATKRAAEAMQINVSNASSSHVLPVSNAEACPALSKPQIPWNEIFDNPKGNMYSYSRLQPDSIRLLGLMPHEDENAPIQGQPSTTLYTN
jgi:hypothetical protein